MLSRGHKLAQGKSPVAREKVILASCKQLLRLMEGAGYLTFVRVANGGVVRSNGRGGTFMTRNVDMAGVSDLIIWLRGGPVLCVELKAEDGRISPDQAEFCRRLQRVGHQYHVVRSSAALEDLLVAHGVPRLTLLPSKMD